MAIGGNTWAYRMKKAHSLSLTEFAILTHIGFRDAHALLSDSGIARDLGEHRQTVQRITKRLAEKGIIVRRGNAWIPAEMVEIVENRVQHTVAPPATEGSRKLQRSVAPREKRNNEKRASARKAGSRPPLDRGGRQPLDVEKITAFERSLIERNETLVCQGRWIERSSEEMARLRQAIGIR